jgi:hypothetical protein
MHGDNMGLALAGLLDQVAKFGLGFPDGHGCAHAGMVTYFDQKGKSNNQECHSWTPSSR